MNIKKVFENCVETEPFSENCYNLLNRIMSISSPVKFDNEFASEEELNNLESELDRFNIRNEVSNTLRTVLEGLQPHRTNDFTFI